MNFMKIDPCDMNNGAGIRVSLFVSGCSHGCKGCFNSEAWGYRAGSHFGAEEVNSLFETCNSPHISGISILGGEPLSKKNAGVVLNLLEVHKETFPHQDRWLWSGYTFEEIMDMPVACDIYKYVDFLIDGKYDSTKPTKKLWRGSDNQRLWHRESGVWKMID